MFLGNYDNKQEEYKEPNPGYSFEPFTIEEIKRNLRGYRLRIQGKIITINKPTEY